jgi:hypothetical protein
MRSLEPFAFRLNRNGGSLSCFDAFSSREPVSTRYPSAGQAFAGKRSGIGGQTTDSESIRNRFAGLIACDPPRRRSTAQRRPHDLADGSAETCTAIPVDALLDCYYHGTLLLNCIAAQFYFAFSNAFIFMEIDMARARYAKKSAIAQGQKRPLCRNGPRVPAQLSPTVMTDPGRANAIIATQSKWVNGTACTTVSSLPIISRYPSCRQTRSAMHLPNGRRLALASIFRRLANSARRRCALATLKRTARRRRRSGAMY